MTRSSASIALLVGSLSGAVAAAPQNGHLMMAMAANTPRSEMARLAEPTSQRRAAVPPSTTPLVTAPLEPSVPAAPRGAAPLDLRLPEAARCAESRSDRGVSAFQRSAPADSNDSRLRDLESAYAQGAKAETMQAIVGRVRHDGFPVARLWENKSALVSVGLNGRGKPGIWLVQKVH